LNSSFYFIVAYLFIVILFCFIDKFQNKYVFLIILAAILVLISGLRNDGIDYANYLLIYNDNYKKILEPGIILVKNTSKLISNSSVVFFILFALIGVGIKFVAIYKITKLWYLTILVYSSYYFIYHDMIQIRTGIASGFLLLIIDSIYKSKWKLFTIFLIISILFHISALIFLPLCLLNKHKFNNKLYLSIFLGSYIFVYFQINSSHLITFINIDQIIKLYNSYIFSTKLGLRDSYLNIFSFIQLIRIFIVLFLIKYFDIIKENNFYFPLLLKVYIFSICCYNIFSDLPVIAVRVSQLLGIVEIFIIPFMIYAFNINSRKLAYLFPILISFTFFTILVSYRNIFI
jgi:hypothetical protein